MSEIGMAPLELGMQELEDLEAPGFWTGVRQGAQLGATLSGIYAGIATAVALST